MIIGGRRIILHKSGYRSCAMEILAKDGSGGRKRRRGKRKDMYGLEHVLFLYSSNLLYQPSLGINESSGLGLLSSPNRNKGLI